MRIGNPAPSLRSGALLLLSLLGGPSAAFAGLTYRVAIADPACSDAGVGSTTVPFCSIAAAARRAFPSDTVLVHAGSYREQVTSPISGLPGNPIIFRASEPGVVILGTLNLSNPSLWSPAGPSAWSTPFSPPSPPRQVFLDGTRLRAAASVADLGPGSFFADASGILYVDIGGGNPGLGHDIEAGARSFGFNLAGRNHFVVDGFEVRGVNLNGINLDGSSDIAVLNGRLMSAGTYGVLVQGCTGAVRIESNLVSEAGSVGIRVVESTGVLLQSNISHHNGFHGIELQASSGNTIVDNVCHDNSRPAVSSAAGIDLNEGSSDNLVAGNTSFHNDDSGIEVRTGSNRNVVARNVAWNNLDHGLDILSSLDSSVISNTSVGNRHEGLSVEGGSTGTTVRNNILTDNGLGSGSFDLLVDPPSVPGFQSDYDIIWNSTAASPIRFGGSFYSSLAAFAGSTGQEMHGIAADPAFLDGAAGDLSLRAESPAIDSADASVAGFLAADHDGRPPIDLFAIPDSGAGTPAFADRGALEYDAPPVASLVVAPSSGSAPLSTLFDASASVDLDSSPIATYRFDFGDGSTVGPQAMASASHTYTVSGPYTATVTVSDTAGVEGTASVDVTVFLGIPGDVKGLAFADSTAFSWDVQPDATTYNVYRGDLGTLSDADGDGVADSYGSCLHTNLAGTSDSDPDAPAEGRLFFYLVNARNSNGEGPTGNASNGLPHPSPPPCF